MTVFYSPDTFACKKTGQGELNSNIKKPGVFGLGGMWGHKPTELSWRSRKYGTGQVNKPLSAELVNSIYACHTFGTERIVI